MEVINISTTGMLFRHRSGGGGWTAAEVLLPEGKCASGSVSWRDGDLVGFKFDTEISKANVAAVVLKGEPLASTSGPNPGFSYTDFLQNLSRLRAAAGMSMDEVAEKVGVSRQAVWYWEQGRSVPRPGAMQALLQVLGGAADQTSGKADLSPTTFGTKVRRLKAELAAFLGVEESAIRIIVEQ